MNASNQSLKISGKTIAKMQNFNSANSKLIIKSEVCLNQAFDGLNLCELRTQSVPGELGSIISAAVASGAHVYGQAHHLHQMGSYKLSERYSKTVYQLCTLLNFLAEEQSHNILKLPLPPRMHLINAKKTQRPRKLHPSLNMLDSFIRRRMTRGSKFYKGRLKGFAEIISQVSNHLNYIEDYN